MYDIVDGWYPDSIVKSMILRHQGRRIRYARFIVNPVGHAGIGSKWKVYVLVGSMSTDLEGNGAVWRITGEIAHWGKWRGIFLKDKFEMAYNIHERTGTMFVTSS